LKFNLKNKPIAVAGKRNKTLTPFGYEVNSWFEGFEKELRKLLEKSKINSKLLKLKEQFIIGSDTKEERFMEQAYRLAIKEILGES